jgi:hypothetical protein
MGTFSETAIVDYRIFNVNQRKQISFSISVCSKQTEGAIFRTCLMPFQYMYIQGGALNRGLFFADPPLSLLGAVSGKISEIR